MAQIAVFGRDALHIGDWQSKARALQNRAQVAQVRHGQDARRQTAGHLDLGPRQRGAQVGQGLSPRQDGKAEPVRAQGAAALDKLAHRVVGPVQAHGVDHQIVRLRCERQNVIVAHDPRIGKGFSPELRLTRHHGSVRKPPVNHGEAILRLAHRGAVQEQIARRAGAVPHQRGAVGEAGCLGHGG